jgi:hypothetical protein
LRRRFARRDSRQIVRLPEDTSIGARDMDAATAEPGVRPFDMTGRPMRGIVVIDSAVLDDKALDRWIGQARTPRSRPAAGVAQVPPATAAPSGNPPRLIDARNAVHVRML